MRFAAIALLVGCGSAQLPPTPPAPPDRIDRQASLSIETRYFDHEVTYYVSGPGVELAKLPMTAWLGLPWSGRGSIGVMVKVPLVNGAEDWSLADGTIKVLCESCQMGDDQAKLLLNPGSGTAAGAFAGDGIPFGHIAFSTITAEVKISGGNAELTTWTVESKDVKIELTGRMSLMPKLDESHVEACLRFATTPALEQRDPRLAALLGVTGAERAADGMYNIRISGPLGSPRRYGQICDGSQPLAEVREPVPAEQPADAVDADELAAAIDKGITKVNETTYDISLSLVGRFLDNPMALAKGARIVPSMKDGKANGFKLYAIRPSGVFAKLGLSNGDTITSVGGRATTTADEALETYTKLRDLKAGDMIYVEVTRRGKPITMTYTFSR